MNESNLSRIPPHQTGLLVGFFLGIASIVFGLIAIGIMLLGNDSFEVVSYGLGIENRYLRVLMLPPVAFFGGYLFTFTICKVIRLLFGGHDSEEGGT